MGTNIDRKSDEELLNSYRKHGNQQSLGFLYDRYLHLVYGLCLKYLKSREASQDAVMDIYELLVDKLKNQKVKHFKSWLYIVSKNHCLMQLRKSSPEAINDTLVMESVADSHPNDKDLLEENLEALEDCMSQLKSEQKNCVSLFYLKRKSYEEVADLLDLPMKTVKSFIQNGRRNLKICLENKHDRP